MLQKGQKEEALSHGTEATISWLLRRDKSENGDSMQNGLRHCDVTVTQKHEMTQK